MYTVFIGPLPIYVEEKIKNFETSVRFRVLFRISSIRCNRRHHELRASAALLLTYTWSGWGRPCPEGMGARNCRTKKCHLEQNNGHFRAKSDKTLISTTYFRVCEWEVGLTSGATKA